MIHTLKYAIIADIGHFDLTFYDPDNQPELEDFCKRQQYSFLPGKDRKSIYRFTDRGFQKDELSERITFNPYDRIFSRKTMNKFKDIDADDVGFIVERDIIKGVVHIVDYNSEFVKLELYRALHNYDKNLQRLLLNNLFRNQDYIDWVEQQMNNSTSEDKQKYWTKRYKTIMPADEELRKQVENDREVANAFETFFLSDLLEYAIDMGLVNKENVHTERLKSIRNSVIYSMDVDASEHLDEIYEFDTLRNFVLKARGFFEAYEYLEDKVGVSN